MFFSFNYLLLSQKSVPLQCVFHSIRFKVNKGWSKALLLFLFCTVSMRMYMKNILSYTKKGASQKVY
ncbi:hypothetical protein NDO49_03241 [Phocaeicola massiliensis]|nr:hypothetical protein [Phocaeicola massiliensis]